MIEIITNIINGITWSLLGLYFLDLISYSVRKTKLMSNFMSDLFLLLLVTLGFLKFALVNSINIYQIIMLVILMIPLIYLFYRKHRNKK